MSINAPTRREFLKITGTASVAFAVANLTRADFPPQDSSSVVGMNYKTPVPKIAEMKCLKLSNEFAWSWMGGLKQILGSWKNGLNVYQISRAILKPNSATNEWVASPDNIAWINEKTGKFGVYQRPTGSTNNECGIHAGGMATFDSSGTIWLSYGARSHDLPLKLYKSLSPYNCSRFKCIVGNIDPTGSSTAIAVHVLGSKIMLIWRHGGSIDKDGTLRFRRYDMKKSLSKPELEKDIFQAGLYAGPGFQKRHLSIEQPYTRLDKRSRRIVVTLQWYDTLWQPKNMVVGMNPVIYSDNFGDTWFSADGKPHITPVRPFHASPILVPYNHFDYHDSCAGFLPGDIGMAPDGSIWITNRISSPRADYLNHQSSTLSFFHFHDGSWKKVDFSNDFLAANKGQACGATKKFLVAVYSENYEKNIIKIRISSDSGRMWSEPIPLITLEKTFGISWIVFVEPDEAPKDDMVRLFYGTYKIGRDNDAVSRKTDINWVRFSLSSMSQ